MPRNGSGTFSLVAGNPVVTGTAISSTTHNNTMSDIATALTNSLAKNGETTPTANLPMGGYKFTGLSAGTTNGDSVRYDEFIAVSATANANLNHGQCYLSKSGANLLLSPKNGNKLVINGVAYAIPAAGVTLAATSLTPSTVYFIYAYMNGSTMTLEASTTTHATDSTTGVEIKSGDATRTLIGQAYCDTGPAWVDSATKIGVLSYFNRKRKVGTAAFTANRSTSSNGTPVEVNSEIRINFLAWNDDLVSSRLNGGNYNSTTANGYTFVGVDGVSVTESGGVQYNSNTGAVSANYEFTTTEGTLHYTTLAGFVSDVCTHTWIGNASGGGRRCSNQTIVWG